MKDYEELPPIVIERGQGVWLYDVEGNRYLDAISSWWTNLFGHCNKRLNDALKTQVDELEHVIFANFSHKPAIELSQKLVKITPKGLEKVFFSDDGSTSVEVALKMSFQYHQQKGNYTKLKFACFTNSYHGETLGALSVGSIDLYLLRTIDLWVSIGNLDLLEQLSLLKIRLLKRSLIGKRE